MLQSMGSQRGGHDLVTEQPPINTYVQFKLCSLVEWLDTFSYFLEITLFRTSAQSTLWSGKLLGFFNEVSTKKLSPDAHRQLLYVMN